MRALALALAIGITVSVPLRAEANLAAERLAAGDEAGAARAFEAQARAAPETTETADLLFSAATLYEERLHEPRRAAELYREILARHPDSRVALASRRRLDAMTPLLDGDGATLARWSEILGGYDTRDAAESIAMAEGLLRDRPDWAGAPRVRLWLGDQALGTGKWSEARRRYQEALRGENDPELITTILRRQVQLELSAGDAAAAARALEPLMADATAELHVIDRDLQHRVDIAMLRMRIYRVAVAAMILVTLALLGSLLRSRRSPRAAVRALLSPPTEVLFALPVLACILALAFTGFSDVAPAVAIIGGAGIAYAWLSGAGFRGLAPSRRRATAVVHALLCAIGVCAAVYVALHHNRLIDQIADTVRFGPET